MATKPTAPKPTTASAAEIAAMAPAAKAKATEPKATEPKATEPKAKPAPKVELATITVLATANPKREGTKAHRTFNLYRTGMTTHEFIQAGGFSAALAWDVKHGFISLKK